MKGTKWSLNFAFILDKGTRNPARVRQFDSGKYFLERSNITKYSPEIKDGISVKLYIVNDPNPYFPIFVIVRFTAASVDESFEIILREDSVIKTYKDGVCHELNSLENKLSVGKKESSESRHHVTFVADPQSPALATNSLKNVDREYSLRVFAMRVVMSSSSQ